jgi:hypothetical protein
MLSLADIYGEPACSRRPTHNPLNQRIERIRRMVRDGDNRIHQPGVRFKRAPVAPTILRSQRSGERSMPYVARRDAGRSRACMM